MCSQFSEDQSTDTNSIFEWYKFILSSEIRFMFYIFPSFFLFFFQLLSAQERTNSLFTQAGCESDNSSIETIRLLLDL